MAQTILNFNISSTNEKLTPRTGVAIFGEYLKGMNLEELCNKNIPNSVSCCHLALIFVLHKYSKIRVICEYLNFTVY